MASLTDYLLESKSDWPDPATPTDDPAEGPETEATPTEWAGDLYEEGDESNPDEAFAVFTGGAGLEAWLDRADDGTLTGWVRDPEGSVFRYSDVDAWAIDVRDAGMNRTDPGMAGEEEGDPAEGEEGDDLDPDAEQDPFADEAADQDDAVAEGEELDPEDPDAAQDALTDDAGDMTRRTTDTDPTTTATTTPTRTSTRTRRTTRTRTGRQRSSARASRASPTSWCSSGSTHERGRVHEPWCGPPGRVPCPHGGRCRAPEGPPGDGLPAQGGR